jgi:hypothetical protein
MAPVRSIHQNSGHSHLTIVVLFNAPPGPGGLPAWTLDWVWGDPIWISSYFNWDRIDEAYVTKRLGSRTEALAQFGFTEAFVLSSLPLVGWLHGFCDVVLLPTARLMLPDAVISVRLLDLQEPHFLPSPDLAAVNSLESDIALFGPGHLALRVGHAHSVPSAPETTGHFGALTYRVKIHDVVYAVASTPQCARLVAECFLAGPQLDRLIARRICVWHSQELPLFLSFEAWARSEMRDGTLDVELIDAAVPSGSD